MAKTDPFPPRRRTRDPDAKRAAVHAAALALFSQSGFEAVSVADIAKEAGVAVGTVYRLYPNKKALLRSLHRALEDRFIERMREAWNRGRPFDMRFTDLCEALFDLIAEEREELTILGMTTDIAFENDALPGDAVRAEIETMIAGGIAVGTFRSDDPALLAAIGHGMVDGAMRRWLRNPTPEARAKTVASLSRLMHAAIVQ